MEAPPVLQSGRRPQRGETEMIKLLMLVSRKQGTSREDFRNYYERAHAPLAAGLMAHCKRYVRNFVADEPTGPVGFDAVTEMWFDVDGPWDVAKKSLSDANSAQILAQDEVQFIDRAATRIFTVHEHETPADGLPANRR